MTLTTPPSTETSPRPAVSAKLVAACIAVVLAVVATFALTRPTATPQSFTPLSGLVALKAMAAEAVPYDSAIASPQPTLIEFYADWCTTCQGMSSTVAQLHEQYGDQVNFVMLDIDDPRWASQIAAYGASGVPQFTLLDSTHHEVDTLVGKVPKPIFQNLFAQVLTPAAP
ncbi:MAG: thioredoxin domain-containing protein [Cyanobacteria bacterium J06632_22]